VLFHMRDQFATGLKLLHTQVAFQGSFSGSSNRGCVATFGCPTCTKNTSVINQNTC
jgi:hypothetical protein